MYIIGIDPGAKGALCLLSTSDGSHEFIGTPNTKDLWTSLQDIETWLRINPPFRIGIEDVHSLGGMSAKSNFQFGRNLGLIEALAHLSDCVNDIEYIQPKAWQKACGITFEYPEGATTAEKSKIRKSTTCRRALELYPSAKLYGPRGGLLDGYADALMIAHALSLKEI